MKKFLITISPLCGILFAAMWVSLGLKETFAFFGAVLFVVAVAILLGKWVKFVEEHFSD